VGAGRSLAVIAAGFVAASAFAHPGHHHHHHRGHAAPQTISAHRLLSNEELARRMAAGYGWTGSQWSCLDSLWTRESAGTWSSTVRNPYSGALGIAQALGHGPTNQYPAGPANGPVYSARAQIAWGLGYIHHTYGTPCVAWSDWQARDPHWY